MQKPIQPVPIPPPPPEQRAARGARFAAEGEKKTRYTLPTGLESASPVGYRTRPSLTREQTAEAMTLLSLEPPTAFVPPDPVRERELFEESALGVLSARQSTNFRGHRQVTLGPERSAELAGILRRLQHLDGPVLDGAAYTQVVFSRPYRTAFTLLLTFIGHKPGLSLFTVPQRAMDKYLNHADDIPTIGYLQHLHIGILADAMERAAPIASGGRRVARVHLAPFTSPERRETNAAALREIDALCGLRAAERRAGWRVALVAQVGQVAQPLPLSPETCRRLGAALLSFRSERIQPGVNAEAKAPPQYHARQDMDVPDELTVMAGRAAYNAFARWSGADRERGKELLILDRIDVLTPNGKQRLRALRRELEAITDQVVATLPTWADLPLGKALSRNAARGRKAFALAGQRIYVGGLSRREIDAEGLDWEQAVCAVGAAAARSGLVCELMGSTEIPEGCDLLAGLCLMAGPVNQNDIGKSFYGYDDLLAHAHPDRDPTAMLVWTLKAKTVADPIGNEEQLMNAARKGALVDLRCGPHEVVQVERGGALAPMRSREGRVNQERAFGDVENFVTGPDGGAIPGNRGAVWPWGEEVIW